MMNDTHSYSYLSPTLPRTPKRQILRDSEFGGLSRYGDAERLTIWRMSNMSHAAYPALATRMPRSCCHEGGRTWGVAHGMTVYGGRIYHAHRGTLYERTMEGTERTLCTVSETPKTFVPFGNRLIILPDKLCFLPDTNRVISMEIDTGAISGVQFQYDGVYLPNGMAWTDLGFCEGDAVTVEEMSGGTVIAAITYRIHSLIGRQGVFEGYSGGARSGTFRFRRRIPDGTSWCTLADGKRLAACVGDTVYLCEENNPFNWYCPSVSAPHAGAISVRAAASGEFTACAVWQRQAVFFKESAICRLTGYDSDSYALSEQCGVSGVPASMRDSLCECDGALYYCTHAGVFRYDGGRPALVSTLVHDLTNMIHVHAGSDLLYYHLVVQEDNFDSWHFVYSPAHGTWYQEDEVNVIAMVYHDGFLYMQDEYANIWAASPTGRRHPASKTERDIKGQMVAETVFRADWSYDPRDVRLCRLALRATSEDEDGELTVMVQFDYGDGKYKDRIKVANFSGQMVERLLQIPVPSTQCQGCRIWLFMKGRWIIHSLTREIEVGEQ